MAQRKTATKTKGPARKPTKAASHKTKSSCGKQSDAKQAGKMGDQAVTVDRRRTAGRRTDEQENVVAPTSDPLLTLALSGILPVQS